MASQRRDELMRRSLTVALCVLTAAVFGLVGYNWYLKNALAQLIASVNDEPALEYGDRVDMRALARAFREAGYPDDLAAQKYLLLYFMRPSHFEHLRPMKYGNVLLQRHAENGLQVLIVSDAEPRDVGMLAMSESLSMPSLYDKDLTLKRLLRVPEHYEHTFLLASDGRVVLSFAGVPPEDLLRQIVEKQVVGKIEYSRSAPSQMYKVGESLPRLRVSPVASGGPAQDFAPRDAELVLISARCMACQMRAYMQRYRELVSSSDPGKSRYLIFSQRFPRQELLADLTEGGVPADNVFLAREPLGDLESDYRTKTGDDDAAVIVSINREGRIEAVRSLDGAQ